MGLHTVKISDIGRSKIDRRGAKASYESIVERKKFESDPLIRAQHEKLAGVNHLHANAENIKSVDSRNQQEKLHQNMKSAMAEEKMIAKAAGQEAWDNAVAHMMEQMANGDLNGANFKLSEFAKNLPADQANRLLKNRGPIIKQAGRELNKALKGSKKAWARSHLSNFNKFMSAHGKSVVGSLAALAMLSMLLGNKKDEE